MDTPGRRDRCAVCVAAVRNFPGGEVKKWEKIRSKDMAHYSLFNSIIATLAFLGFIAFFHSTNGGSERIINDYSEYVISCAGIFAGSAIGSCFGWKVKEE
jgi:hypothetical protein